jgi:hypothetical protein
MGSISTPSGPSEPGTGLEDLLLTVGQLVAAEAEAVAAEGVGQEHLGPGLAVGAVDRDDPLRMLEVGLLEALVEGDPTLVELGAHGAVQHQDPGRERLPEGRHGGRVLHRREAIMPHMPGDALDFDRLWLPYIYLYAVGGALFLGGLFLVLRSGALDMKRRGHRRWLGVLVFGLLWYMGLHLAGHLAAIPAA